MAPSLTDSKNPRGSDRAYSRVSIFSIVTYGRRLKVFLAKTVLPDCLGPVMATMGNPLADFKSFFASVRGIMIMGLLVVW